MNSTYYPAYRPRFSIEHALLSILFGLLLFSAALLLFILGFQVWYAGRIFPGVRVAGVDVGGMKTQDAANAISASVAYPFQGKIVLRDGNRLWTATPAQLGLYLDPQTSARAAFEVGRTGWLMDRLRDQFYTWYLGRDLPPAFLLDGRATYAYLAGLAKEIDIPTVEASLELRGTDVIVHPGQVGRSLDIPRSLTLVSLQVQTMRDGVVDLFINESVPVILDASQQAELARGILSQPLTLTLPENEAGQGGPWTIDQPTLAAMLAFERVQSDQGMQYQVNLKTEPLRQFLEQIAPPLVRHPQNPRFIFNDQTRQLEVIQPTVTGRELDIESSIQAIQEQLPAGNHTITLVMKYENPPVTDQSTAESLGITQLIHEETSYFYGSSSSRVQNITTAASKFHGLLVAPGETFSMASAIGDITLDNGYAEAMIILGGQTIKGVGGGVCQVSTTLFRAAFFAGFPIVERHAHAYRVYYYEKVAGNRINPNLAGLDATVFVPLVDFKFTNDTPYWLLMETYVNPASSSITWKFYSTSDGRTVDWNTTGPVNIVPAPEPVYRENPDLPSGTIKQVDWAADGADVTVNRTVYRDNQVYLQDTLYTHYQPWSDVFEYGPGTELPNQDGEDKPEG